MRTLLPLLMLVLLIGCQPHKQDSKDADILVIQSSWSETGLVTLFNGKASIAAAPGSSAKIDYQIDKEISTDLNKDGLIDRVIILLVSPPGSGHFYYLYPIVDQSNTEKSEAILLGDRITINSLTFEQELLSIRVIKHELQQPKSDQPIQQVIMKWQWHRSQGLVEVVNDNA